MNKGQLRAHFKALLNRSDCTDALADTFIDQAQARIQRLLRVPSQEAQINYSANTSTGLQSFQLPNDLLEIINISYDGQALVRVPFHELVAGQKTGALGKATSFARQRATILLHPQPTSGIVTLDYYGEFPPLVNDTDTNGLTSTASDLFTYVALTYAADYFLDERGTLFEQKSAQFLAELQSHADAAEQSGANQVVRPTHRYDD